MTPEQIAMFRRMQALFPGITQASPPTTSSPQAGLDFLRQQGFGGGRVAGPMSTPGGTSSFYRQFGIGPNTRLSDFGRTGQRTTMPNFRAAIQPTELTDEGREFFRRLQQGLAQQADDVSSRGLGSLFARGLSRVLGPLGALMPDRMGDGTLPDELFGRLNPPEAMGELPGGGMSVPIPDSGAMSPAQDSMYGDPAPSPMGMPGMLESPDLPEAPPAPPARPDAPFAPPTAPPVPSVQSGFGYTGYDSADVGLSIDILPPRGAPPAPTVPAAMDSPARATDPPPPAAPAERELAPSVSPFPTPRPEMQGPAMPMYEVQRGDYLGKIAQNVGLSLADLIALNPQIENPDLIFPGQMLNLS